MIQIRGGFSRAKPFAGMMILFLGLSACAAPTLEPAAVSTTVFSSPGLEPTTTTSLPTATESLENIWISAGPESALITALALDPAAPSTLYAGTDESGVFKSIDSGGSWTAVNDGLGTLQITALAVSSQTPGTLFAGTADSGVYRSINGGAAWKVSQNGLISVNTGDRIWMQCKNTTGDTTDFVVKHFQLNVARL